MADSRAEQSTASLIKVESNLEEFPVFQLGRKRQKGTASYERTRAGLEAARSRGRKGGPKHKLTPKQVKIVRQLYKDKSHTLQEICDSFGVSRVTLWRYVKGKQE